MKTYFTIELIKATENIPTWLGWTVVGILVAATLAVIGFTIAEIVINK